MAILPAVFAFGQEPAQGPGLIFAVLPQVFSHFGPTLGPIFMLMFFIMVIFAALTTTIAVLEVISAFLIDSFGWSRKNAVLFMSAAGFLVGIVNVLSMSVLSHITIGGDVLFDALNWGVDKILIPSCALLGCVFVVRAWGIANAKHEITNEGKLPFKYYNVWRILVSYIIPVFILIIMVCGFIGV